MWPPASVELVEGPVVVVAAGFSVSSTKPLVISVMTRYRSDNTNQEAKGTDMSSTATTNTTATPGQTLAAELRRYFKIGTRTRRYRNGADLHADMLEAIKTVAHYPGCYTERTEKPLRAAYGAFLAYSKHVDGYRIDGPLRRRITELSPWQFANLLGRMVDAGVTNCFEGEMFFNTMARTTR